MGDGNFHVALLIDPNKPEELEEAERINQRIVARAIAMDGTCTGEHGVGLHKMDFLIAEHGNDAIDLMRSVKQALDPEAHPESRQDLPPVTDAPTSDHPHVPPSSSAFLRYIC
ncbi:FAD-binding oxidoreductase [Cupriavidus basilensis]